MPRPVVLFLHRDPVVHELVTGTLGDEFSFVAAQAPGHAARLAAQHSPAVIVIDVDAHEAAAELAATLRARDPHVRLVFFADTRDPSRAWLLSDLGTVLAKNYDLERLRMALRKAVLQHGLAAGVDRTRDGASTTQKVSLTRRREDTSTATERIHYHRPPEGEREVVARPDAEKGRNPLR